MTSAAFATVVLVAGFKAFVAIYVVASFALWMVLIWLMLADGE